MVRPSTDHVAVVVAIGVATAINIFVAAALYAAITHKGPGLTDVEAEILSAWGTGLIGILGAYVGYRAGQADQRTPGPPGERGMISDERNP